MNDLSKEARELLASLSDADGPSDVQTARMKRNLGISLGVAGGLLAVGGATGAAHAAASAAGVGAAVGSAATVGSAAAVGVGAKVGGTGVLGLLSVFALGAAAGVGVSTTSVLVRNYAAAPAEVTVAESRANDRSTQRAPVNAVAKPLAVAGAAEPAPLDAVEPPATRSLPPSAPPSPAEPVAASAGAEPTLGPELELVIVAKRELTLGRAAQALAIVERLAVEFPNGALREERRLLKVLSLCALGQLEPARREARAFAAAAPRSPLLPRLEQSCGGEAGPAPRAGGGH